MPYIGSEPNTGLFVELDSLSASATADYTLQLNGADYFPETVNNLLVSINGVIQGSSTMALNGSTLTVGATLSSSDVIDFVRVFGNVGSISTPTDGSVTANKIGSGAVDLTSKVTGVLPVANGGTGYANNLAWHFTIGTGSNSGAYVADPMDFNFIQVDTHNIFSTSTNKITIPRTGLYFMTFGGIKANSSSAAGRMQIIKNNNVIGIQARGEENSGYAQMYGAFTASLSQGDTLHAETLNAGMWCGGTNTLGSNDPHWSGFYIGA